MLIRKAMQQITEDWILDHPVVICFQYISCEIADECFGRVIQPFNDFIVIALSLLEIKCNLILLSHGSCSSNFMLPN